MKRCPKCNQVYADDNLNFCLTDGASLLATSDSEPTLVMSPPSFNTPSAIGSPSHPQQPSRQGVSPLFAYAAVGLLALLIGGGIVIWLKSDTTSSSSVANQNTMPSTVNSTSQNSGEVKEEPKVNRNQITPKETQTERPITLPPPTVESVQSLMNRWENAQDTQNFTAYESCYGYSFRGVLRTTSGRVKVYGFNEWMKDRRRMINQIGGLEVDVRNTHVRIDGDTATVEFDQYYRSGSYGDWGPKVIKIKATPDGEKIVYEELKASYSL
jgi:hypothetical protein